MIKNIKIKVYLTTFTVFFLEILKKKKIMKKKKKSSENDQLTGHFQSFLIYFFRPPDPKSKKNIPVNQPIKKSGLKLNVVLSLMRENSLKMFKMLLKCL